MQAAGAETFAVAGARAHDQRQAPRVLRFDEALLQRRVQRLRNAALHEAGGGDDVVVADQRDGFVGRNDLVLHHVAFPLGLLSGRCPAGQAGTRPSGGARYLWG